MSNTGSFGLSVVERSTRIPLGELNMGAKYQRSLDKKKVEKIVSSMKESGIWPKHLLVNQKGDIIDGQHRAAALCDMGEANALCTVVRCKSEKAEAGFFTEINSWPTTLSPSAQWHARLLAEDPMAKAFFSLAKDHQSDLFHMVRGLQDVDGMVETRPEALSTNNALILVVTVLQVHDVYKKSEHSKYLRKIQSMSYESLRRGVNRVFRFMSGCFGENPDAWTNKPMRSAMVLYRALENADALSTERKFALACKRMNDFEFIPEYKSFDQSALTDEMFFHYNKGLKKGRIQKEVA